jgi:hypothetical protein
LGPTSVSLIHYWRAGQIEVEQEETLAPPTLEDAVAQHDLSALSEATATRDESTFLSFSGNMFIC